LSARRSRERSRDDGSNVLGITLWVGKANCNRAYACNRLQHKASHFEAPEENGSRAASDGEQQDVQSHFASSSSGWVSIASANNDVGQINETNTIPR
jgi:hypothetical protein